MMLKTEIDNGFRIPILAGIEWMLKTPKQCEKDLVFWETLLKGLCHDLGAPARHVVEFSKIIATQTEFTDEKPQQWLSIIQSAGESIQEILTSLSLISRISADQKIKTALNLEEVFHFESKLLLAAFNLQANVNLSVQETWPTIIATPLHWSTLMNCLLKNAMTYHDHSISSGTISISAICYQESDKVFFSIEDNGIGVAPTKYKDIVQPFKRLHSQAQYPGIGMGLTVCDFIAQLNDGELSFYESELGGLGVHYQQPLRHL